MVKKRRYVMRFGGPKKLSGPAWVSRNAQGQPPDRLRVLAPRDISRTEKACANRAGCYDIPIPTGNGMTATGPWMV